MDKVHYFVCYIFILPTLSQDRMFNLYNCKIWYGHSWFPDNERNDFGDLCFFVPLISAVKVKEHCQKIVCIVCGIYLMNKKMLNK